MGTVTRHSRGFLTSSGIHCGTQSPCSSVDNGYYPIISHSRWPNNAQHTDPVTIYLIRRRDDTALIQQTITGLCSDKQLHTFRINASIQKMQNIDLQGECLEHFPDIIQCMFFHQADKVLPARQRLNLLPLPDRMPFPPPPALSASENPYVPGQPS